MSEKKEECWVYATVCKPVNAEDEDHALELAEEEIRKDLGLEKDEEIPLAFSYEID